MGTSLKSKSISDYFEAKLQELRPGEIIPFTVYLYFSMNAHIMVFKREGDYITDAFLDKYIHRGISFVWIHKDDLKLYEEYLKEKRKDIPVLTKTAEEKAVEKTRTKTNLEVQVKPIETTYQTESGKKIAETLKQNIPEPKKTAAVANEARKVLAQAASQAATPEAQKEASAQARAVVEDVLRDKLNAKEDSFLSELWKLAKSAPEFEHGANVAMYATLLALAFGRIQNDLITDLAFAGLLHDIGLSQIDFHLNTQPWKSMSPIDRKNYAKHVEATLSILGEYAASIPPRVSQIIYQHHEKFDGTGYPKKLEGFKIDDISQLLAVADLIDSMCCGRWDGTERTLTNSFDTLERIQKSSTFPEHFNPEIFAAVLRWIRSADSKTSMSEAMERVKKQRGEIVESS